MRCGDVGLLLGAGPVAPKPARLRRLADVLGTPLADLNGLGGPPQSAHLGQLVAQARREIAEAAGTTPAKVKIIIEM